MKYTNLTIFLTAFGVLALDGNAATTISTTLTMTSPSAIISATGVSASAYITNISTTNLIATNAQLLGYTLTSMTLPFATAYISETSSGCTVLSQYNVGSCTRMGTGLVSVSFTTPAPNSLYKASCMHDSYNGSAFFWLTTNGANHNNTGGFYFGNVGGGGVTAGDGFRSMCIVYP